MAPIIIENKMKQYQQFKDNKVHNGLFSLMTWFSPSYPIGSFAYSHGLEYAVEAGIVTNTGDLKNWLYDFLHFGTCYNDSIFISNSYDATEKNDLIFFNEVAAMSKAFKSSSEISLESEQQGISFYQVTSVTLSSKKFESLINGIKKNISYPVVVGCAGSIKKIRKIDLIDAYLHSFISNILSASLRIMPLGQTEAQCILSSLEKEINLISINALSKTISDLGSSVFMGDWASANHEGQYTRLFRS